MTARLMLPADLEPSERPEYERLRSQLLTRDEAIQAIKKNRSKRIVKEIYNAGDRLLRKRTNP